MVQWALGSMVNGERELLGAWPLTSPGLAVPSAVLADLHERGADLVRFGIGAAVPVAEVPLSTVFRGTEELPSIEQALAAVAAQVPPRHRAEVAGVLRAAAEADDLHAALAAMALFARSALGERYPRAVLQWREALARLAPTFALHAQLRELVRHADCTAMRVQQGLQKAIQRHGPFADQEAALDFICSALQRAERRLDRERAEALDAGSVGAAGAPVVAARRAGVMALA
jgi:putative transposase